jgi:lysophospholipase L1-like esterase
MTRITNSKPARKFKSLGLIVAINLLLLEGLSFVLIHSLPVIRPDLRLDLTIDSYFATITDQDITSFQNGRDPLLGWNRRPFQSLTSVNSAGESYTVSFGADGSREDLREYGKVLIATYGDSFTEGGEVNNHETWQTYLEKLIEHDVKNFGVSGYGIGQAYLKLRRHFDEGRKAPVTMLVIYVDDLSRAVNNFRWFLNRKTDGELSFKPSFRYLDGAVRFFPNPPANDSMKLDDLKKLTMKLARQDYWMSRWLYFEPKFPYAYQIAKAMPMISRKVIARFQEAPDYESIWSTEEGNLVAKHIIEQFYRVSIANDSIPVLLFIPNVNNWANGRKRPEYHDFKAMLLEDSSIDIATIDIYDANFDESRFSIQPFQGHPSPYGNQIIASHVASKLKELDLIR